MDLDIKLMCIKFMLTQRFGRKNIFLQPHHPVPLARLCDRRPSQEDVLRNGVLKVEKIVELSA